MEEQGFENKERTVYLSSTGDFVKTDLTNPREIKYASEIQLANKSRDKFFGLKPLEQDRAEITRAAMDDDRGILRQIGAGAGASVVSMGQNLWNWARYTNANLINKGKRKLNELSASILKGTGAIDEETRANMMTQVNNDYKAVRDIINGEMLKNREKQNAYLEKTGLAKKEGDSLVYDIANGVGSAAAALGLAIVTKSPNAAALMFGGVAGQSGYEEALAAGIEPEKALKVGLARGFFEGSLERIGLHCYIEGLATRGVLARIAKNAVVEGVQEMSQQTAEEILQTKYGGRVSDWKRATEDILLSGFVGMIVGGGFASVGAGQELLNKQKANDTGAKPLPAQNVQNIDLTDVFESGVKRFTDLGMPVKDAENLTFSLLKKAAEPETAKEIVDMIKEENSNLTYINNDEDQNAAAVAEAIKAATAPERVVKQQAFDIADKVEEQALKAGRTPEEAAASAELAQKASMGLYNLTGVLPQDQYEINIALEQDGLDASENGLTGQEDTSFDFGENQKMFQEGIKYDENGKADINTPEFKNWFGDSKVVDENGEPLVVYHGGAKGIDTFSNSADKYQMFYFTDDEYLAEEYRTYNQKVENSEVYPVYLSMKKPLNLTFELGNDKLPQTIKEISKKAYDTYEIENTDYSMTDKIKLSYLLVNYRNEIVEYAKANGYDGLITYEQQPNGHFGGVGYIVFEPTQIKSVYNKGTFDPKNPNIFYQPGYHGGSKNFDRFDLTYNGTGEGPNVHGWGVYITKSREVAEGYRENISGGENISYPEKIFVNGKKYQRAENGLLYYDSNGKQIEDDYLNAANLINDYGSSKMAITGCKAKIENLTKELKNVGGARAEEIKADIEYYKNLQKILKDNEIKNINGQVYEVDIPENEVLIDEQKTFNEQPKKVQDALKNQKVFSAVQNITDNEFIEAVPYDIRKQVLEHSAWDYAKRMLEDAAYSPESKKRRIEIEQFLLDKNKIELSEAEVKGDEQEQEHLKESIETQKGLLSMLKKADYSKLITKNFIAENKEATGKEIYEYVSSKLGGDKEASLFLNSLGIKGITYMGAQDGRCYVVFDDKAVKILQTFYQGPRGSVTFADDIKQAFVRFNETADKSTLVHELGHIWLKNIEKFADYARNPEFADFKQNLDSWLGAPVNGVYTVEQQEKFAQTFERYLQEGKAPNAELKTIFERFKEWLSEIYAAVKNYIELSPEAIKTFDTLLAGTGKGQYNIDKIKTKTAAAKAVVDKIKKGQAVNIDGVSVQDIKEALKVMNSRIPAEPKENLLRTLRSKGADYANASKIDKEAYKNARVPNKKTGIQDGLALTLRDWGYMDFDDSAVADYEGLSEKDEEAADLIDRALSGEKIYKVGDEQANKREQFLNDVEKAREVLGPNGEEVARAITELEKKGYRVVEKEDINFLEKQLEQLDNILEKTRIINQNPEDQKKTEAFEKMQKQNALEARRIKDIVLDEINKREIAGKEEMLATLKEAKTPDDISDAVDNILTKLEKEFEQTPEGQAEQRKLDIPATNWDAKKITLLKDINEISAKLSKEEQEARDILSQYHLSKTGFAPSVEPKALEKARKLFATNIEKKYLKAFNDALRDEPHLNSKDINELMRFWVNKAIESKGLAKTTIDWFLSAAQRKQEANYKKYMHKKIKDILDLNLFDKQGNLRKAMVDPASLATLLELKRVSRMKKETAAGELAARMENFSKSEEAASPSDKIINEMLSIQAHDDENISVQLMRKAYDDIHDLRKAGRSARNLQKLIMDYRTEQEKSELLNAIKKNKEAGWIKKAYASWLANWESMLDVFADKNIKERYSMLNKEADTITYSWQRRNDIMEGVKDIYNLGSNSEVQNKMNELRDEKYTFTNYALVDKNKNPYALVKRTGEPFQEELSKMQIITAYIYNKNVELSQRLAMQYGKEQLEEMWSLLDNQDKRLANFLQKEAEKSYNQINEVFVKERGYDLPKVDNYFPSVTERVESELDFLHASAVMSKNPSFTKMRVASPFVQMKLENPFGILFRHIERAADYHFKAEKLNQIRRVFKSPVVKPAIIEKVGEDVYKRMLELIDQFSVTKQTLRYDIDKLGDWLTNNYVKGAIALKPTIAIKQLISSMNYAENMPTGKWIAGFVDAIMHPKQTVKFMFEGDPYLKTRYESGSMNEALARATADANAITARGKFLRFTDLLSINTRLGDIGAIMFGGKPYVDYLMNEKGLSKAEAFAEFRKSTLRSQQSNTRSSLSTLQGHDMNWLLRGLFAFKNTPAQYARKIADGISQYQRGEIDAKQLGKVVAIYGLLNSWMYSMLTTLGLIAWFYDRDEAKELLADEILFSPFTQMASSLPVLDMAVGQAANVAKAKMFDKKVQLERPEMPVVSEIFKMGSKALKEDVTAEDVLDMFVTGGQVFGGLPTKYAKGLVTGGADIATGKNPMRGFLQALGYTENRAGKITGTEEPKKKRKKSKRRK